MAAHEEDDLNVNLRHQVTSVEAISDFYKTIKEDYPDLTLTELNKAVRNPWINMRRLMIDSKKILKFRFKYFGLFSVYKGTSKAKIRKHTRLANKKIVSKEEAKEVIEFHKEYLKREFNEDYDYDKEHISLPNW
jgi:hypothetical protein